MRILLITIAMMAMAATSFAGHERVFEMSHKSVPYMTTFIRVVSIDDIHFDIETVADYCAKKPDGRIFKNVKLKIKQGDNHGELERYGYDFTDAIEIDRHGKEKTEDDRNRHGDEWR